MKNITQKYASLLIRISLSLGLSDPMMHTYVICAKVETKSTPEYTQETIK